MKLKRLRAKNFAGLADVDIEFYKPVGLFYGTNNQGKSSVRDAILYAARGRCRAMSKFNEAKYLTRPGGRATVKLDYISVDGTQHTISKGVSNASNAMLPDTLGLCLDPLKFIAMSSQQRARVLTDLKAGDSEELTRAVITQHIGNVDKTLLAVLKDRSVNFCDLDAFRGVVVEYRRECKRLVTSGEAPLLVDYDLPDDFEALATENNVRALGERIKKGATLIAEAKQQLQDKAELVETKNALTKLAAKIVKVPPAPKIPADDIRMGGVYAAIIEDMLRPEDLPGSLKCPLCESRPKVDKWRARFETISGWLTAHLDSLNRHEAAVKDNAAVHADIDKAQARKEKLDAKDLDTDKNGSYDGLLDELTQERDGLQEQLKSWALYEKAVADYKIAMADTAKMKELVAECDRIDVALKDGGPVKEAVAAAGTEIPIDRDLLGLWGMEALQVSDVGEVLLGDVAIEYASSSEQYRAGAVMAMAIAEMSGIGIVALDGFDILDKANANALMEVAGKCKLKQILIFVTTDKVYDGPDLPAWLEAWQVEEGEVRPA